MAGPACVQLICSRAATVWKLHLKSVTEILTLTIVQEEKSLRWTPPSYSCRGRGGTGNLPLVFIANRRSKVIDVTFTLLLLPLGCSTSNSAHTNKLQSAADAREKKKTTHTEGGGWGGRCWKRKGQTTNSVFARSAKNTPFQLVYFLASHLLIKTAPWNIPTVRRRCFKARPFALRGSLVPPGEGGVGWWMRGKAIATSFDMRVRLNKWISWLGSRESFMGLAHNVFIYFLIYLFFSTTFPLELRSQRNREIQKKMQTIRFNEEREKKGKTHTLADAAHTLINKLLLTRKRKFSKAAVAAVARRLMAFPIISFSRDVSGCWYLDSICSQSGPSGQDDGEKGAQLGFAPTSSFLTETQFANGSNFIPSPSSQSMDIFVLIEKVKYVSAHLDAAHEKSRMSR